MGDHEDGTGCRGLAATARGGGASAPSLEWTTAGRDGGGAEEGRIPGEEGGTGPRESEDADLRLPIGSAGSEREGEEAARRTLTGPSGARQRGTTEPPPATVNGRVGTREGHTSGELSGRVGDHRDLERQRTERAPSSSRRARGDPGDDDEEPVQEHVLMRVERMDGLRVDRISLKRLLPEAETK